MNNFTHEMRWKSSDGRVHTVAYMYNSLKREVYQRKSGDVAAVRFEMQNLREGQAGWLFVPINLIEANE
jgi:hypothetical protein